MNHPPCILSLGNGKVGDFECTETARMGPTHPHARIMAYLKLNPEAKVWHQAATAHRAAWQDSWDRYLFDPSLSQINYLRLYLSDNYCICEECPVWKDTSP